MNIYVVCAIVEDNQSRSIHTATFSTMNENSSEAIGEYVKWVGRTFPNKHIISNPAAHEIPREMIEAVSTAAAPPQPPSKPPARGQE